MTKNLLVEKGIVQIRVKGFFKENWYYNLLMGGLCIPILLLIITLSTKSLKMNKGNDWIPQMQIFEGVEMVLVPSGCFMMGSSEEHIDELIEREPSLSIRFQNQTPQTSVCFDEEFWIDKYLVTNEQFNRFGGSSNEASYWNDPSRPRETITWDEAREFCSLRGARLLTEAEWEYAARGSAGLIYPWGDNWMPNNAVWSRYSGNEYPIDRARQTANVGSRPSGASWVGALDMAGNLWEWTSSAYEPYPYFIDNEFEDAELVEFRTLRGGSWAYSRLYLQTTYRLESYPSTANNQIGFRCMRLTN